MRRSYISPEFSYNAVYGTFNMIEDSSLMCSKMVEIEDEVYIRDEYIQWYQRPSGEQIEEKTEINFGVNTLDTTILKKENSLLSRGDSNDQWILNIKVKKILEDYLFATLKKFRTFEGLENTLTLNNNVDNSIRKYINSNIVDRYSLQSIELFIDYNDIVINGGLINNNVLSNKSTTPFKGFETQTINTNEINILFKQSKNPNQFNFIYNYNLVFKKI